MLAVGFFVFSVGVLFSAGNQPIQAAAVVRSVDDYLFADVDMGHDELIDWMREIITDQQKIIDALHEENTVLIAQIASTTASTTATTTEEEITSPVDSGPRRILLVAGHTAVTKGAVFGQTTEYEINYELLKKAELVLQEKGYEVVITHRDDDYSYRFTSFFEENRDRILEFRQLQKDRYDIEYPMGVVTNDTDHNYASDSVVLQLYGVNLWANENDIDAVVHIHFNDYPGRPAGQRGTHTGFSIFTGLKTNTNFVPSFRLAKALETEMLRYADRSTVPKESAGVLESELIAVGQADSVDPPAILLEGGFVYEEKFTDRTRRSKELANYAQAIGNAVDTYFEE